MKQDELFDLIMEAERLKADMIEDARIENIMRLTPQLIEVIKKIQELDIKENK